MVQSCVSQRSKSDFGLGPLMDHQPGTRNFSTNQPDPLIRVTSHANHKGRQKGYQGTTGTNGDQGTNCHSKGSMWANLQTPGRLGYDVRHTTYTLHTTHHHPSAGMLGSSLISVLLPFSLLAPAIVLTSPRFRSTVLCRVCAVTCHCH